MAVLHDPRRAMSGTPPPARPSAPAGPRNRRTLLLIALVTIAPVVTSYSVYYLYPRDKQANYGELLATRAAPELTGVAVDGKPFRLADLQGHWVLAVAASRTCDAECAQALYAMRQARTMQGREKERIARVLLLTAAAQWPAAMMSEHPGLVVAEVPAGAVATWPAGADAIYVLDPLGNFVLAFPRVPDIRGLAKDITRLLKASRIG